MKERYEIKVNGIKIAEAEPVELKSYVTKKQSKRFKNILKKIKEAK